MNKIASITFVILIAFCFTGYGQNDKVKFWANSRGFQQNARLGNEDTINLSKNSSGYVLGDIGLNINPLKNTEIQAIMRLRTDLGGFYGSGASATLRRLSIKGLIANVVSYEVGDMYLKLSPYTLYNNNSEGQINEATVFRNLRQDIVNYDYFYRGNYWWQQGAHVNFATGFRSGFIDKIKYDAFVTRIRTSPTMRLSAGGRIAFMSKDKFSWAFNYINVFDDRAVTPGLAGITNPVVSSQIMYKVIKGDNEIELGGEGGFSSLNINKPLRDTLASNIKTHYSDFFVDGYVGFNVPKSKVNIKLGYRYVGPDFRSAGAQTKRVNFNGQPEYFNQVANQSIQRQVNLFDITRSTSVYNLALTPQLMAYDPRLTNTMPYGAATPNRQGVYLEATKNDSSKFIGGGIKAYYMMDAVGYGSQNKRHFQLYQASLDLRLHNALGWTKQFVVYGGAQMERTNRSGGVSAVKLNSVLIDGGLDVEVLRKLYVIGGVKLLRSKGNEFILNVDEYNMYSTIPIAINGHTTETLYGYGLKYRFGENSYLTVQDQLFYFKNIDNKNNDYSFNQFFIMYFLRF